MDNPIIVTITDGRIRGKVEKDYLGNPYYCFLGVPYGKAPVGDLRFKAPVPVEPWDGIKDATKEGPECPSRHTMFLYYVGSEDNCLHVNVYTTELPLENAVPKPVMIWIHGGGFLCDSNKMENYGPDYLMTEDIVLVCVSYRLGVFGFLSLEDPSLEVPGNAGMKDMILALQWVQRNINNFGGDPNNVTVFGESAGGAAVHYLYLSPKSKGLFHKAIVQSGCVLNSWVPGCTNGSVIAENLGYYETNERKILEYLKTMPPKKIVNAQHKHEAYFASTVRHFGPVVEKYTTDTAFLTEEPIDIIKAGKFNHVPLIIGNTSREGILIEAARQLTSDKKMYANLEEEIYYFAGVKKGSIESKKIADSIRKFYYGYEEPSESNIEKYYLLKTDNMFLHGTYKAVSYQKEKTEAPIYFYEMSLDTPINFLKYVLLSKSIVSAVVFLFLAYTAGDGATNNFFLKLAKYMPKKSATGACHGDDLCYLFKSVLNEKVLPGSNEEIHVKRVLKLWTNFARTGNPTPDQNDKLLNVVWKPVTKEDNCLLDIGTKLEMKAYPNTERMQFWDTMYSF